MPLIDCPDCRKKISDAAPACPQCGRPADSQELRLARKVEAESRSLARFASLSAAEKAAAMERVDVLLARDTLKPRPPTPEEGGW